MTYRESVLTRHIFFHPVFEQRDAADDLEISSMVNPYVSQVLFIMYYTEMILDKNLQLNMFDMTRLYVIYYIFLALDLQRTFRTNYHVF